MKKSVVLTIAIIYIVAVVAVGVFGISVRIPEQIVYVDKITCVSDGYKSYEDNQDKLALGYDGYISKTYSKGLKVVIQCAINPIDATNGDLIYIYDESRSDVYTVEVRPDGTAVVSFHQSGSAIITIKAADSKGVSTKIEIYAFENPFE